MFQIFFFSINLFLFRNAVLFFLTFSKILKTDVAQLHNLCFFPVGFFVICQFVLCILQQKISTEAVLKRVKSSVPISKTCQLQDSIWNNLTEFCHWRQTNLSIFRYFLFSYSDSLEKTLPLFSEGCKSSHQYSVSPKGKKSRTSTLKKQILIQFP